MTLITAPKSGECFHKLAITQKDRLDKFGSSGKIKKILLAKEIVHFLFDKTDHSYLPEYKKLEQYQLSSASNARQSVMDSLCEVSKNEELSTEVRKVLLELSEKLNDSLDLAIIIDGWRSSLGSIIGVLSGNLARVIFFNKIEGIFLPKGFSEKDIEICASEICDRIRKLKEGDYYTFVSGSRYHDIQILIRKKEDDNFEIVFYNTGEGMGSGQVRKISNLSLDNLSEAFFKKLILIKLQSLKMDDFQDQISKSLGSSEEIGSGLWQKKNTCAYLSLESLVWDQLRTALGADEAKEQYKIFIALRNEYVVRKTEREATDDEILTLAQKKIGFQERYILYGRVEDIALAEETFIKEIEKYASVSDEVIDKIKTARPIEKLNILHHELERALKEKGLTQSEIGKILRDENVPVILRPSYLKVKSYVEQIPRIVMRLEEHYKATQSLRARSIKVIADRSAFFGKIISFLPSRDFYLSLFMSKVLSETQIAALVNDLDKMTLSKDQIDHLYNMSLEAPKDSFYNERLNFSICKQLIKTGDFDKLTYILDRIADHSLGIIINMLISLNVEMAIKVIEKYEPKFWHYQWFSFLTDLLKKDEEIARTFFEKYEDKIISALEIMRGRTIGKEEKKGIFDQIKKM
ncbi:MAG: hypothetical protein KR126chlam5_01395 [Candidatus Anoxychlamydiales bacterium]|nr:hypothetical protein [Candidatus Anoxychlamydiales bacterium]